MDKDQVLKTLRQSKQLEGPPTDALLSRTGLNGVFKTKQSTRRPDLFPEL